jgi:hypothetical protein
MFIVLNIEVRKGSSKAARVGWRRKGCRDECGNKEEMGDGLGKGAREKSNCEVGRANAWKLRAYARGLTSDIVGSAVNLNEGCIRTRIDTRYSWKCYQLKRGVHYERA